MPGFYSGGERKIDLIAVNELEKYAEFIEVKLNAANINIEKLLIKMEVESLL